MINVAEALKTMKTSLLGYDKENVQVLIKDLLDEFEQEENEETAHLKEQNRLLQRNLKETSERLHLVTQQFKLLTDKMDKMTEAVGRGTEYSRERDRELEAFHKKEEELDSLHARAVEEAKEEKQKLLCGIDEERKEMLKAAGIEYDRLILQGQKEREQLIREADEYRASVFLQTEEVEAVLEQLETQLQPLLVLKSRLAEMNRRSEADHENDRNLPAPEEDLVPVEDWNVSEEPDIVEAGNESEEDRSVSETGDESGLVEAGNESKEDRSVSDNGKEPDIVEAGNESEKQ